MRRNVDAIYGGIPLKSSLIFGNEIVKFSGTGLISGSITWHNVGDFATPRRLLNDFRSFGSLFESLCVRDLRVYAQPLDGEVRHYRDQTGLEADMIVVLKDGRWGAIEVKLGAGDIDSAAEGLKKLKAKVDVSRMGHPSFMMVLTENDLGYTREDGVVVCPLGCLRP